MAIPSDYAGLTLWLKGDDYSYPNWPDASGNGIDFVHPPDPQTDDPSLLIFEEQHGNVLPTTTTINGHQAVVFNIYDIDTASSTPDANQSPGDDGTMLTAPGKDVRDIFADEYQLSFFAVLKCEGPLDTSTFIRRSAAILTDFSDQVTWEIFKSGVDSQIYMSLDSNLLPASDQIAFSLDTWVVVEWQLDVSHDTDTGTLTLRVHGLGSASSAATPFFHSYNWDPNAAINLNNVVPAIGDRPASGGRHIDSFNGPIAEIISYANPSGLTCAQRNGVRQYLADKYALSVDLEDCGGPTPLARFGAVM